MRILTEIFYLVAIGLVAGFLAATILGERRRYGIVGYIVVGAIGAIAGNYIFGSLDLPNVGILPRLIAAVAGSIVLVLLLRLVRR